MSPITRVTLPASASADHRQSREFGARLEGVLDRDDRAATRVQNGGGDRRAVPGRAVYPDLAGVDASGGGSPGGVAVGGEPGR
jgi:hypothetical protein